VRLGEAISRRLAKAGYHVLIHAHSHLERAEALATELGGTATSADLSRREGVDGLFEVIDALNIPLTALVNNAGVFFGEDPEKVTAEQWDFHLAVNLTAPFRCCQLAAPRMREAGGGAIVNMLDVASLRPERDFVHYSATKAGLESVTRGLATHWAPEIRVNGIAPGAALLPEDFSPAERAIRLERTPMGEEAGAAAMADSVLFLLDGPRAITGTVLTVDGGFSARW